MPYKVEERGGEWVTFNPESGKVYGKHPSKAKAVAQQRALYANAPPEGETKDATCKCDCLACKDSEHGACSNDCAGARQDAQVDRVRRFDVAPAVGARRMDNGWLRAEGTIARTGVQEYRRGDGTVLRELRLPEEVFRKETMDALQMAPVTDEHPTEMLDASNTQRYARGHLGENIAAVDGKFVKASLLVTDAALVEKVLSGKQAELSVGYWCDLDHTPGTWNGEHYDCVQRNIVPNHVAVTARARGGPELRVHLDSADGISIGGSSQQIDEPAEEHNVKKIQFDAAEFEVSEAAYDAIQKEREAAKTALAEQAGESKAKIEAVVKERDAEKVRADSAEAKLAQAEAKTEKAVKDAEKGADARVRARISLEAKAVEVLGAEFKVDGLSDMAIRRAVVAQLDSSMNLDGKEDGYVLAAYDLVLAHAAAAAEKGKAGLAATRAVTTVAPPKGVVKADAEVKDSASLREKRIKESEALWQKPTIGAHRE